MNPHAAPPRGTKIGPNAGPLEVQGTLTTNAPVVLVLTVNGPPAGIPGGGVVVTVEAMKMEHALAAPVDGVVELLVAVGDQVKVGQPLARITASTKEHES